MRPVNQAAEQESSYRIKSPLLFGVLQQFDPETRYEILDLSPANTDTLDFFSPYRCRLHLPGCRDTLLTQVTAEAQEPATWTQLFNTCLPWPEPAPASLDLLLLWDLPNYLNEPGVRALIDYLAPCFSARTALHMYIHTRQTMPVTPCNYRITGEQQVQIETFSAWTAVSPVYYQERLHKLFAPFRVERGMLLANGLQEYVMRIPGTKTKR